MWKQQQQRQTRAQARHKRMSGTIKDNITCVTRTVELSSTQADGKESSKLLFMLSLGLVPNMNQDKRKSGAVVNINRLDPKVEADARVRTKAALMELAQKLLQKRELSHQPMLPSFCNHSVIPSISDDVEMVDLVSSDDEETGTSIRCSKVAKVNHENPSSSLETLTRTTRKRTLRSSPDQRKPLQNNNQVGRSRKSKSASEVSDLCKSENNKRVCTKSMKDSQTKLQPSSKFLGKVATAAVKKFPLRE